VLNCDLLPLLALRASGCPPDGGGRQAELLPAGEGYRAAPRAELVTIQGGGMGLLVQPRTADVGGRRVAQELFFNGVPGEPGDGGQLASDSGAVKN
jgi:hypothetical protein